MAAIHQVQFAHQTLSFAMSHFRFSTPVRHSHNTEPHKRCLSFNRKTTAIAHALMANNKVLAYILTNHDLKWRSFVYPFCDSKRAPKKMAFELFYQVEKMFPAQLMAIGINDDEAFGVAIVLGDATTTYDDFPEKLKKWAQHNFECEPRVFTRDGLY